MSGFTFYKRGECPVCSGLRNDCRQSDTTGLIFCRETVTTPTGYNYRGEDAHGFGLWQSSTDLDAFTQQSQEERERRRREYLAAKEQRKQQQISKQLSATERDTHYRAILKQLHLSDGDNKQLLDRGFTLEQITQDNYRSIEKWQDVGDNYPSNLPGILSNGVINAHESGIICPISNKDGLIVGCQLRLNKATDKGRYRWLTSATKKHPNGSTPHLNGELPIVVLEPSEFNGDSIWVAEGTAFKPSLLRHRLNVPVLGAASGRFNTSPKTTKAAAEYLSNKYQTKILTFAIDAGDVANQDGVPQRWLQQFEFFSKLGYEIRIAWWGQSLKSFSDIDELESFENITYLNTKDYKALCVKWGGIKDDSANNISPIDYQERVAYEQKKLHSLTYPADYICDYTQKYLPNLVSIIPKSGIVALKAPKGSGKSHQIEEIKNHCCGYTEEIEIKPEVEPEQLSIIGTTTKNSTSIKPIIETIRHKRLGMNFVSINARIALGRAQAVQWDFTWIEDADIDSKDEFGSKVSTATAIDNISEIGCCWDSLGKFFDRDWSNTLVVIDEIELGLNHLSTSSTCKDRRSLIFKTLEVKLKECLENGGLVIVADADFTNVSYDYLKAITGYTPYIVQHTYLGDPWEIDFYTGKRDLFLTQIEDWVSDENCEPIAIALDNQAECEAVANHLMKNYPYLKNKVGGLIRVDSKVTQTDFGKDFVKHTNQRIKDYLPKILLYTPSLGVGCSIDVYHFKHVFGLFYGNLEPSQARQMLARVRQSVPRSVWCKARASNSEDTPTSYLPSEIKKRLFSNQKSTTEVIELALQLAKEKAEGSDIDDKEILPLLIEQLQSMMGNGGWDNAHVDLYCKQIARRNYSLNQLAVQLRQELIDEGHELIDVAIDEGTVTGDSVRFEKNEIKHQKAEATAKADDIEVEQAMRIKNQPSRTEEENHKATKALLKRELPGVELTADFLYKAIYKDDRRWLNQIKLFWMANNPEITKELDSQEWRKRLRQFSNGVAYLPDVKSYSHKVEVIEKTGLLDFLNPLEELTEDSPKIQQFIKDCHRHRKKLKSAFGIHLTSYYPPIKLLNRLLERIGLKMGLSRRERQGKDTVRYYKLNQNDFYDTHRLTVIESLNQKFKNDSTKCTQTQTQQALDPCHKLDYSLNKKQTSVTANKPESEVLQDVTSTSEYPADILRSANDWGEIALSQQQINEAWGLLTEPEQAQLHNLYADYQQRNYPPENYSQLESVIAYQTPVNEVGFGREHFRQYQLLRILNNGLAWVKRLFGDKGEFEISISQLVC